MKRTGKVLLNAHAVRIAVTEPSRVNAVAQILSFAQAGSHSSPKHFRFSFALVLQRSCDVSYCYVNISPKAALER